MESRGERILLGRKHTDLIFLTAISIGFLGSLHCVAMCGPLNMIALSGKRGRGISFISYHSGRIMVYALLGVLSGMIGKVLFISELQSWVSLAAGICIILLVLFYTLGEKMSSGFNKAVLKPIKKVFSQHLGKPQWYNKFSLGVVNGLLPCGLVYLAVAGSLLTSGVGESVVYMISFGLGTLPALVFMPYFSQLFQKFNLNYSRLVSGAFLVVGVLLVLRGAELGIPYISPSLSPEISTGSDITCQP